MALRLRSLGSLGLGGWAVGRDPAVAKAHCAAVAGALERLPSPEALTALGVVLPAAQPDAAAPVIAALGRFTALRSLAASVEPTLDKQAQLRAEMACIMRGERPPEPSAAPGIAALLRAADALPALVSLRLSLDDDETPFKWPALADALPRIAELPLWGRLEALTLRAKAAPPLLGLLAERRAGVAPRLGRLRALDASVGWCGYRTSRLLAAVFAAPWLPQLTMLGLVGINAGDLGRLLDPPSSSAAASDAEAGSSGGAISGSDSGDDESDSVSDGGAESAGGADSFADHEAPPLKAPPPLRAVAQLKVAFHHEAAIYTEPDADAVRRLLADINPATLEELSITGVASGATKAVAERALEMTRLRALELFGGDQLAKSWNFSWGGEEDDPNVPAAAWGALQRAPFAPLERLDASAGGGWLLAEPERLAALLAAPWAASLAALTLGNNWGPQDFKARAGALDPLSGLPQLRRLVLICMGPGVSDEGEALWASEPGAARWARRLEHFEVVWERPMAPPTLVALAALPFERLEFLHVGPFKDPSVGDLRAFGAAGAAWLPRLATLQLDFDPSSAVLCRDARCAAALDFDGPLRALHRGGGEVRLSPPLARDEANPQPGGPFETARKEAERLRTAERRLMRAVLGSGSGSDGSDDSDSRSTVSSDSGGDGGAGADGSEGALQHVGL